MKGAEMKRVIVALCSAAAILIGSVMMPMTAHAKEEEKCSHIKRGIYVTTVLKHVDTHPLVAYYGQNGPVYDTCHEYQWYEEGYKQCILCDWIDFSQKSYSDSRSDRIHTHCQCPLYNG